MLTFTFLICMLKAFRIINILIFYNYEKWFSRHICFLKARSMKKMQIKEINPNLYISSKSVVCKRLDSNDIGQINLDIVTPHFTWFRFYIFTFKKRTKTKELILCHKRKFSNPYIFSIEVVDRRYLKL